jgi:hypothetical protein
MLQVVGILINREDDVYNAMQIDSLNFADRISDAFDRIRDNDDYQEDLDKYLGTSNVTDYALPTLSTRSYYRDLYFVTAFITFPVVRLDRVQDLIVDLNRAGLLVEDRKHFKDQLREHFVKSFMSLMQNEAGFRLPNMYWKEGQ